MSAPHACHSDKALKLSAWQGRFVHQPDGTQYTPIGRGIWHAAQQSHVKSDALRSPTQRKTPEFQPKGFMQLVSELQSCITASQA